MNHPRLAWYRGGDIDAQRKPALRGSYRYRSKGSPELCGYPVPGFLATPGLQLGNVIFVPPSFGFESL
jgi:hypothetical protein